MNMQHWVKQNSILSVILLSSALWTGQALIAHESLRAESTVAFKPAKVGAPSKTRGGASRGDVVCSQLPADAARHFTLLTPTDSNAGLTVSGHPTFFAYVPPTSASKLFFNLKDENGKVHYQTTVSMTGKGGVVELSMPQTAPPLEVGKYYQWGAAILCSGKLRPDSPFVSGWVKRIEPDAILVKQLKTPASLDQAAAYGAEGIWYDTLSTLAALRRQQSGSTEIASEWKGLLHSVGLDLVASEPWDSQH